MQDDQILSAIEYNSMALSQKKKTPGGSLPSPQALTWMYTKIEKRRTEHALTLLQARVLSLKLQDGKQLREIRNLNKKNCFLLQSKTRNYLDSQLELNRKQQINQQLEEKALLIKAQRDLEKQTLQKRKELMWQRSLNEIQFQKRMKQQLSESLKLKRSKQQMECYEWYQQVKSHQRQLEERKREFEEIKTQSAKENYRMKVEKEIKHAVTTQVQLERIEQQEIAALEHLQKTQSFQRDAIEEFKSLVRSPKSRRENLRYRFNI